MLHSFVLLCGECGKWLWRLEKLRWWRNEMCDPMHFCAASYSFLPFLLPWWQLVTLETPDSEANNCDLIIKEDKKPWVCSHLLIERQETWHRNKIVCVCSVSQWPKSVDKSDFVGTAWNSSFSDHNRLTICSIVEIKSFSRAEFYKWTRGLKCGNTMDYSTGRCITKLLTLG